MPRFQRLLTFCLTVTVPSAALALDSNGNGSTRDSAISLYVFQPANIEAATGIIRDLAPNPLNLQILRPNALYNIQADHLEIVEPNIIRSVASADKIINACKASNAMTIEMWVESRTPSEKLANHEDDDLAAGTFKQGLRFVSLADTYFKEFHNFSLQQFYNMGDAYRGTTRTTGNSNNLENRNGDYVNYLLSPRENFLLGKKQHVYLVRTAGGVARLYNSDENGNDTGPFVANDGFNGNFSNWHSSGTNVTYDTPDDSSGSVTRALDMRLAIGNEPSGLLDISKPTAGGESASKHSRHWPWVGKIYMMAIYCRALTEAEILGSGAPRLVPPNLLSIDINSRITTSMQQAQTIYERIVGLRTPVTDPVIQQMAELIDQGNSFAAAGIATQNPGFLNITVRDMAAKMSTREETISTSLNDFTATMIGAVRDKLDARTLLTGNYFYMADPTKAAVPSHAVRDLLTSNRHYESLQAGGFDLAKVLVRKDGQRVFNGTVDVAHPDPAGLLTSRAFMAAHAVAGTNRRLVEYTFREFLCTPIDRWSNSSGSDAMIGRDVDRFPGGSHTKFTSNCRSCHSQMDPLRGAFAYFTFSNGFAKHSFMVPRLPANANNEDTSMGMLAGLKNNDPALTNLPNLGNVSFVATKMNHNEQVFPNGRVITDNSFQNATIDTWGMGYFGWRGPTAGRGVKEFGRMVSESAQYSKCLAQRVFASVCKREPQSFDQSLITTAAKEFETDGQYKLDYLFKKIVTTTNCLGELR